MENVPSEQEGGHHPENVDEHLTSSHIPELLAPAMYPFFGCVGAKHHQPGMSEISGEFLPTPERNTHQHHDLEHGPDDADPVQRQDRSVLVMVAISSHRDHHLSWCR